MQPDDDNRSLVPGPSLPAAEMFTQIERLLGEEDWQIRAATAKELGQRGDLEAVEPLCLALTDKIWHVRIAAVGALGRLQDPRSVEPLCGALEDTDWYIRIAATVALGQIGDARAVEPLCVTLADTDAPVRSSAAGALGRIGDVWAVEALCSALKDKELDVRLSAGRALDLLGTEETLPLRVLSSMTLTPAKLLDTLRALTEASPRIMKSADRHENARMPVRNVKKPVRYQIGDVATFCERVCRHIESTESMKRNAAAVLTELQNRTAAGMLLRASARTDAPEKEELLRGASGSPDFTPPDELLRAADASSENPTREKPGLLARIFKRK